MPRREGCPHLVKVHAYYGDLLVPLILFLSFHSAAGVSFSLPQKPLIRGPSETKPTNADHIPR